MLSGITQVLRYRSRLQALRPQFHLFRSLLKAAPFQSKNAKPKQSEVPRSEVRGLTPDA
jgi:hypothetical protein